MSATPVSSRPSSRPSSPQASRQASPGRFSPGHVAAVARFLWRSGRRLVVIGLGFVLLVGGVLMLVLPGPGVAVIVLGLALLAREFVWAERLLERVKARASATAGTAKRLVARRARA